MSEPRRIRPPKHFDVFIESLLSEGIFETKQAIMMFAAAIGYRHATRKTLETGGEGIRWGVFEKNADDAFINALALAERKSLSVLDPDAEGSDELPTIFEEYATGGFEYLDRYLRDTPGDVLQNLLAIVQEYRSSQLDVPMGLEGLGQNALGLLGDLKG